MMREIPNPMQARLTPVVCDLWLELVALKQPFRRRDEEVHQAFHRVWHRHFGPEGGYSMKTAWDLIRAWGWCEMVGDEEGPKTTYKVDFNAVINGSYPLPEQLRQSLLARLTGNMIPPDGRGLSGG